MKLVPSRQAAVLTAGGPDLRTLVDRGPATRSTTGADARRRAAKRRANP